jgi:hypothetical protein
MCTTDTLFSLSQPSSLPFLLVIHLIIPHYPPQLEPQLTHITDIHWHAYADKPSTLPPVNTLFTNTLSHCPHSTPAATFHHTPLMAAIMHVHPIVHPHTLLL